MKTIKILGNFWKQKKSYHLSSPSKHVQSLEDKDKNGGSKQPRLKCRYMIVFVGFWIFFLINGYRMNMSVSIVAMVNHSAEDQRTTVRSESCRNIPSHPKGNSTTKRENGEFVWSPEIQSYILGSHFLSYVISQVPAGRLVERFGCKWLLLGSSTLSVVCTYIIPLVSWLNVWALVVVQLVRGLAQGFCQPALCILVANWFPRSERGVFYTIMKSGSSIGACLVSILSGFLCASSGKWPSSFYATAAIGTAQTLFLFAVYESPKLHPKISKAELDYIAAEQETTLCKRRPNPPWSKIFTSVPVYALMFGNFGFVWSVGQFLIVHSTFLGTVLHYPIAENGVYTALPFLLQFVFAQATACLSSLVIRKNLAGVNFIRKFWNTVGCLGFCACMLGMFFSGCNRTPSAFFGILSMGCTGIAFSGCSVSPPEMSPTFAGVLNGLSMTFACMANVILPLVVGHLTNETQTIEQWNKVFFVSIGVVMSSGIVFAIFGSADVQPWNFVQENTDQNNGGDDKARSYT